MAAPNFALPAADEEQGPHNVYINPQQPDDYYDREPTPERMDSTMDRTAQYVSGLNPDIDSYSPDGHSRHSNRHHHHHHRQNPHSLPPITIRRHTRGSDDPSLQRFPTSLQSLPSDNISSSSDVHVTIKRNPSTSSQPIIQPVIQPVFYPVAVYVSSPAPQYHINQPIEPIQMIMKPPSPRKPVSPLKISHTPPALPTRYETELFHPPSPRNQTRNASPRRPVRIDPIPRTSPALDPQRVRPVKVIAEKFDDYDDYYHVPTVHTVPKKTISYRTAPGMTTRELENNEMDKLEKPVYVEPQRNRTITYRAS